MQWLAVLLVAVGGFFGAGAVSMWRTQHRTAAGVLILLAVACVAIGIVAMIPGPDQA